MAFTKLRNKQSEGFTLVELLIVIVVIAILAAITIIAYNGVTQKAKTSQAQSAANSVQQVAELYNTDKGNYPSQACQLRDQTLTTKLPTSIALTTTAIGKAIGGGTASTTTVGTPPTETNNGFSSAPTTPSTIAYFVTTSDNSATLGNVNGGVVAYWDYTVSTAPHLKYVYVGGATSSSDLYDFATNACS